MSEKKPENGEMTLVDMQRKLGADKIEIVKNPKITDPKTILQQAAEIQKEKNQKLSGRIDGFLTGKIQPPNEFVRYMIEKLRMNIAESDMVQKGIRDLENQLVRHREKALLLQGERQSCAQDIDEWDREIVSGTEKVGE